MIAAYRVVVQRWSMEDALTEAQRFGCCHRLFRNVEEHLRTYAASRGLKSGLAS